MVSREKAEESVKDRSITFGEDGDVYFRTPTGYINATLYGENNNIHIQRVFTKPEFRNQGHFKADLRAFFNECEGYEVSVCICPDRLPNSVYDIGLEDALIKVFTDFNFKPYVNGIDVYPTELSRKF